MATIEVNSIMKTKAANGDLQEHYLATKTALIKDAGQPGGVATLDDNGNLVQMPTLAQVGGRNDNLLHNWDWRYAINPLGITTQTADNPNIARWFTYSAGTNNFTLTVVDGQYIRIAAGSHWVQQGSRLERLPGGVYTLSVMLSNGTVYSTTITWDGATTVGGEVVSGLSLFLNASLGYPFFCAQISPAYTFEIVATHIEPGTVSTLKNAPPPDPQQEESKCQRFYEIIQSIRYYSAGTIFGTSIYYSVPKRIAGTTRIVSANGNENAISYYSGSGWVDVPVSFKEAYTTHVYIYVTDANIQGKPIGFSVIADANL